MPDRPTDQRRNTVARRQLSDRVPVVGSARRAPAGRRRPAAAAPGTAAAVAVGGAAAGRRSVSAVATVEIGRVAAMI